MNRPHAEGPFRVTSINKEDLNEFSIDLPDYMHRRENRFNVSTVREFTDAPPSPVSPVDMADDDGSDMEEDEYAISSILDRKYSNGQYEYRVQWVNFKRPTYVRDEDITASSLTQAYDAKHPRGCDPSDSQSDRIKFQRDQDQVAAEQQQSQEAIERMQATEARQRRHERLSQRRSELDYISKQHSIYDQMQYADTDLYELKMKDLATIEEFQKRLRQSEATASDDRTQGGKNDVALRAANEGAGDRCPRAQSVYRASDRPVTNEHLDADDEQSDDGDTNMMVGGTDRPAPAAL